jgi:ligand-binding sensor domain-containing protein/signal transduction histidine kinase
LRSLNISLDEIQNAECRARCGAAITFGAPAVRERSNARAFQQPLTVLLRLLLVCIAFCAGTAYAIDPNRAMSQYIHQRWGAEQGFPHGPVYAISQSSDGYLWIGTQSGLVRFDGLNFRLIKDAAALSGNASVLGFVNDREGRLWMRLEGGVLLVYHDGVIDRPAIDYAALNSGITAMSRFNQGELLLFLLGRGTGLDRRNKLEMMVDVGALPRSPILSVAQTSDGSTWMGTRGAGLFRLQQGATNSITEGLPDPKVNCLLADDGGALWAGTDEGLVRWNGSHLTTAGIPESLKRLQVLALVKDRDANLWVGSDSGGLLRLTARGVSSLDSEEGRSREAVTALFEDREGNLWAGSDSSMERIRDSAFITYSQPEGLPSDGASPVFVDSDYRTWFAPVQGGLWWVKEGRHEKLSVAGLDKDVVYSIAGGNGELWLARQRGGLTELRSKNGLLAAKSYTQADGLAQNSVYSVYLGRDGRVWAGTLSAGVSVLKNGRFTNYTIANGLASNTVASILESSDGTMWFATPSGLSALSNDRWKSYTAKDGLPSENVNCLLQDSAGVLWVGTAAGLSFRGTAAFHMPAAMPAPLHSQVLGLAEDGFGWLWIATSNHVLRVNRDKLLRNSLEEGDVREYGLANGLRGVEGVKRHRSVIADPDGRIWFSLNRGISMVDPARLTRNFAPAIAHIQGISADGSPISLAAPLRIPGGHQRITFDFTGLSLSVPERARFRYMLDGFDDAWGDTTPSRQAVYTNLAPRHYRFRVVASNPDGVWTRDEAAISFDVDPLYWQTWWFRTGFVALCVAAMLALYRLRLRKLTAQLNLRSAERLAERTRIAQELHDTLLQGFLSASMQVHVAADILPADSQARPILARALQLMGQVIDEGRNSVRGLRSSPSITLDLEHAFSLVPGEMGPQLDGKQAAPPPEFSVIVDGAPKPLQPLLRDEVYRIGREALVNAFRHARAKNIEIELKYSLRNLRLSVRDNGCGIGREILRSGRDGHWGLSGMKERADRIGARLHVWSSASAGTEIELTVPGQIAFLDGRNSMFAWLGNRFRRRGKGPPPEAKTGTEA